MRIDCIESVQDERYAAYVAAHPLALCSHAPTWMDMLARVAGGEPQILVAEANERVVGVLPAFVSADHGGGKVLNSLPFFGSKAGALMDAGLETELLPPLLSALDDISARKECRAATVRLSPYQDQADLYRRVWSPDIESARLNQSTPLPATADQLMAAYSSKRRNNVRAAMLKGVKVVQRTDAEALAWMRATHEQEMAHKGGLAKPSAFFDWCLDAATNSDFCRLYYALVGDQLAAGCVMIQNRWCVEYTLPVVDHQWSASNPLVLLIYQSMLDAAESGRTHYDFGGTWKSQESLYRFKNQFGARDMPYVYLTRVFDRTILDQTPEELTRLFPHFFVAPFENLQRPAQKTGAI
jgi:hypothetical protein